MANSKSLKTTKTPHLLQLVSGATLLKTPLLPPASLSPKTLQVARKIIEDIRENGEKALRYHTTMLGDLEIPPKKLNQAAALPPLVYERAALAAAFNRLDQDVQRLLMRTAARIRYFASLQKSCLSTLSSPLSTTTNAPKALIPYAGHTLKPIRVAGCYAPSGRFALPSSVLMTAVTARVAGVETVWVATPKPTPLMLAAAHVAESSAVLAAGGAQGIAALAFGVCGEAVDLIVGPGNRYVTAAKHLLQGVVGIDMLAGPSELVILADTTAKPELLAADLLAQAEHDPEASASLVLVTSTPVTPKTREKSANKPASPPTQSEQFIKRLLTALQQQLTTLPEPSQTNARLSLAHNGKCFTAENYQEASKLCNYLAPEHLEVQIAQEYLQEVLPQLQDYGALFIGALSAEVLGDYGVGPNHVLPTNRSARFTAGLSVFNFLRTASWLEIGHHAEMDNCLKSTNYLELQPPALNFKDLITDVAKLARLEGLEAHARAAEARLSLAE